MSEVYSQWTDLFVSSPQWKTWLFGLVHELLIRFSWFYDRNWAKSYLQKIPGIYVLPFGLMIKSHEQTTENEAYAMHFARTSGLPVPRCFSYGCRNGNGSILMTRIDGYTAGEIYHEATDDQKARFKLQLRSLMENMRSWPPPDKLRGVISSAIGGPVSSYRIPPEIKGPWEDEHAFIENMSMGMGTTRLDWADYGVLVREIPKRPHRIVFTHGDLFAHNILVDEDCRILAIIDWATAGWMPEWWEYAVRFRRSWWGELMMEIGGNRYEWELNRDRHTVEYWVDGYRH